MLCNLLGVNTSLWKDSSLHLRFMYTALAGAWTQNPKVIASSQALVWVLAGTVWPLSRWVYQYWLSQQANIIEGRNAAP